MAIRRLPGSDAPGHRSNLPGGGAIQLTPQKSNCLVSLVIRRVLKQLPGNMWQRRSSANNQSEPMVCAFRSATFMSLLWDLTRIPSGLKRCPFPSILIPKPVMPPATPIPPCLFKECRINKFHPKDNLERNMQSRSCHLALVDETASISSWKVEIERNAAGWQN